MPTTTVKKNETTNVEKINTNASIISPNMVNTTISNENKQYDHVNYINNKELDGDYINNKVITTAFKPAQKQKSEPLTNSPKLNFDNNKNKQQFNESYGKYGNGRYEKLDKLYNARNTIVYLANDTQNRKQ